MEKVMINWILVTELNQVTDPEADSCKCGMVGV